MKDEDIKSRDGGLSILSKVFFYFSRPKKHHGHSMTQIIDTQQSRHHVCIRACLALPKNSLCNIFFLLFFCFSFLIGRIVSIESNWSEEYTFGALELEAFSGGFWLPVSFRKHIW